MSDGRVEQSWYGELYAIHKLKVEAARYLLLSRGSDKPTSDPYLAALYACHDLGLTDEILLERLKV